MTILTCDEMKRAEAASDRLGVSYRQLMENAGCAAASAVEDVLGSVSGKKAIVFCGSGNNGGDGFVAARKLSEHGCAVSVVLVFGEPRTDEASFAFGKIDRSKTSVMDWVTERCRAERETELCDFIIDAVFGTGFRGSIREPAAGAVRLMNGAGKTIFAFDIASGAGAESGTVSEDTVRADHTIAFEAAKPGHFLLPAKEYGGEVKTVGIGMPDGAYDRCAGCSAITEEEVFSLVTKKPLDSNKGTFGRLLSVVGCSQYPGAAMMSTMGALRCGTGIVTVATTAKVASAILPRVPEATYCVLPESGNGMIDIGDGKTRSDFEEVVRKAGTILIGCGIGRGPEADGLVKFILETAECPVVVDADALFSCAANPDFIKACRFPVIMTPHIGEMARLCGKTAGDIKASRVETALEESRKSGAVVVLKDSTTVIASPDGRVKINTTGNPGLAKGGSGDVLAGMIASLSAQGLGAGDAAACGVFLHGAAADAAARDLSQYGMLPSDIPAYLCKILAKKGL